MARTYMSYPRYGLRVYRKPFQRTRWRLYDLAGEPIFVGQQYDGTFSSDQGALAWLNRAIDLGFLARPRPFAGFVGTWVKGTTPDGRNRLFEGDLAMAGLPNVEEGDMLLLSNDVSQDAGDWPCIARPQQSDNRSCLPSGLDTSAEPALPRAPQEQGQGMPGVQQEESEPAPDYLALARSL